MRDDHEGAICPLFSIGYNLKIFLSDVPEKLSMIKVMPLKSPYKRARNFSQMLPITQRCQNDSHLNKTRQAIRAHTKASQVLIEFLIVEKDLIVTNTTTNLNQASI